MNTKTRVNKLEAAYNVTPDPAAVRRRAELVRKIEEARARVLAFDPHCFDDRPPDDFEPYDGDYDIAKMMAHFRVRQQHWETHLHEED